VLGRAGVSGHEGRAQVKRKTSFSRSSRWGAGRKQNIPIGRPIPVFVEGKEILIRPLLKWLLNRWAARVVLAHR